MNILRGLSNPIRQILVFISSRITALLTSFQRPMATSIRSMRGLVISLQVALFVAIIAVGMQPFDLSHFEHPQKTLILLGFGGVAFIAMLISKFVLPSVFTRFYNEQQWIIIRQCIHFTIIVFILTSLIIGYSNFFQIQSFDMLDILKVLAISILPIIVTTFIQQKVFHKKFVACAETINNRLNTLENPQSNQILPVLVFGEKSNKLSLLPNQFIYAETSAESTNIYWQNFMGVEKTTIHTPIITIEKELSSHPQFVRLHKKFIINLRGIQKVEGNARGYQLRIARTNREISVPWKFHKILEKLAE